MQKRNWERGREIEKETETETGRGGKRKNCKKESLKRNLKNDNGAQEGGIGEEKEGSDEIEIFGAPAPCIMIMHPAFRNGIQDLEKR